MRTLLCALFILCAACASDAPVSDYDPHTKTTRHISTIQTKLIPGLAQTQAAAMIVETGETTGFGVKLYVTRYDLNFPKISSAWSFGQRLPYQSDDRRRVGELRQEAGHFLMSEAAFRQAAETGLSFKLEGARASYLFNLPAVLFRQALRQKQTGGG